MLFRVILIGNTHDYKNNKAAAQEIDPSGRVSCVGVICPDDMIEFTVKDVDQGKAFMKQFYKKTGHMPKRYDYVDGTSFWDKTMTKYLGTQVFDSNIEYVKTPEHLEDIQSFVKEDN